MQLGYGIRDFARETEERVPRRVADLTSASDPWRSGEHPQMVGIPNELARPVSCDAGCRAGACRKSQPTRYGPGASTSAAKCLPS